jgi:cytochrome P450
MGVAPPPRVPGGVIERVRSDMRWQRAARGQFPPGELGFSMRRTREFEREPLPLLLRLYDEFGPVFSMRLMYAPVVFAIGPEANHYMTVSAASNFRWRDGGLGDLIPLLGDGLLTTDGDYHHRARRIMVPAFHREQIAAAQEVMAEEAGRAVEPWRPGAWLDLYTWTRRLALRVAMRALFGFDPSQSTEMADKFDRALGFWGRAYAAQMLRGPGSPYRAMVAARDWLDAILFEEVGRRRRSGDRGDDILSLLLDATDEDGLVLSDQELRDQVMTLLFAGHDTTTSTVAFLFYELARNPGDHDLDLAIDETLRMYPPAWIGPRRSIEPFELHGVHVPGGVLVNYCSWASHHLREVFPGPFQFRPERFLPDARAALPKGAYVPFGGGSRTCIGMRFGLLEVRTIAETILARFRLELAEPERRLSIRQMPTLSPRGGLPVVVHAATSSSR